MRRTVMQTGVNVITYRGADIPVGVSAPSPQGRNYDYPVPMQGMYIRQQLARICMDARALHAAINDNDRVPAWVVAKISTATDRLHAASDYLRYKAAPGIASYGEAADVDPYLNLPDGRMIKNTLVGIARDAIALDQMIANDERVATWAPKFIYTAQDRLNVVAEYMRGEKKRPALGAADNKQTTTVWDAFGGGKEFAKLAAVSTLTAAAAVAAAYGVTYAYYRLRRR